MDSDKQDYEALQRIFLEALDQRSPEAREAYLDKACAGDAGRREGIDALLKEYEEQGETIEVGSSRNPVSREAAMFLPGKLLADRYRIVSLVGRGGMGEVYRADDLKLEQPVALKFLPATLSDHPKLLKALFNEVRQARRVAHRHVCRVYDIGEAEGMHFLSMEFIEGEHLGSLLRRIGRLPGDKAIELGRQLCAGLQAAHEKGLLHLDLKPANLMIDERGDLRVTDFGLARLASEAGAEKRRSGTPAYMAPEQILRGEATERSDIYAVGLVLSEMLTGRRVHIGTSYEAALEWHQSGATLPSPAQQVKDLDAEIERIILQCLERDPDLRPRAIVQVFNRLSAAARDEAEGSDGAGAQPARILPTEDLETSDVFIAYAPVDDQPLTPGRKGWISQFHRNLGVRLEQLTGEEVKIWRDTAPANQERFNQIVPLLPKVKTMVSIVSPPFVKSPNCVREVDAFWRSLGAHGVNAHPRLLKAVKTPVRAQDLPPELAAPFSQLPGFEFYEADRETGRLREFDESFGERAKQHYFERVYDVAFEVCEALKECDSETSTPAASGKTVYLAEATSDLQDARDQLRRELQERGHRVVPDQPLPWTWAEFEAKVHDYLAIADLAVHLVGNRYGFIPEAAECSVVELQNLLAAGCCMGGGGLERLIWIPWDVQAGDDRQAKFLTALAEDPDSHLGGEVIRDTFPNMKGVLLDKLAPKPEPYPVLSPAAADIVGAPPTVYLVCDRRDEEAIEALEDYLFDCGLAVLTPHFEGDIEEISRRHREQLVACDGVLVYYGAASKAWVETTLTDVIRAPGYGRERPMRAQTVYVAPPEDRRKARFRTHLAEVVREDGQGFDPEVLADFAANMKEVPTDA